MLNLEEGNEQNLELAQSQQTYTLTLATEQGESSAQSPHTACVLYALLEGDHRPFRVIVPGGSDVYDLAKFVWEEKKTSLSRVDPADLILFKVRHR